MEEHLFMRSNLLIMHTLIWKNILIISNQLPDFVICLSHSMIYCCWLASLGSYISTDTDMSFAALLTFLMCSNMSSKWCLYGPSNAASCHAACSACGPPLYSIHSCRLQCSCSSHPLIPQDCRFLHWMAHLYNSLITYICCLVAIHVQCIEHGCPILMTGTDGYE